VSDGYNRERGRRRRGRDQVLYSRVKRQGEAMPDPGARSRMYAVSGASATGRPISIKTGLPVPEEHLLAVVGRCF
jgi:hypothetical protein